MKKELAKRTRMEDVANLAGTSKATVSKALRQSPEISVATRERVESAARRLGYRQNALVSALMSQIRGSIPPGMQPIIAYLAMTDVIADPFVDGACNRCRELGFKLEIFQGHSSNIPLARLSNILKARNICGLVISPLPVAQCVPEGLRELCESHAVALLGYSQHILPFHRASPHQFFCARLGLQKLNALGYRRAAIVASTQYDWRIDYQLAGAAAAHAACLPGRRPPPPLLARDLNRDVFLRWLDRYKPDALLSAEPLILKWAQDSGRRIPQDIAYAHNSIVMHLPGIAHVDQRFNAVGSAAVDLVVGQLQRNESGIPAVEKSVLIEGVWVDGASAPPKEQGRDPKGVGPLPPETNRIDK